MICLFLKFSMYKLLINLLVAIYLPLSVVNASEALIINTVDFPYLFENYWKVQDSNKKFQRTINDVEILLKDVIERGKKKQEELESLQKKSKNPVLTAEARSNAQEQLKTGIPELRKIEAELAKQRQIAQQNLTQKRNSISAKLRNEIKNVIQQVAQDNGSDFVFDKSNAQNILLFAKESFEITTSVLDILNADKPEGFEPLKNSN